ncbi:hypothetical protein FB472_1183 [Rhodoglobus vestalii]|uniref:Uncharacterized protein n=1 Tax=Rhodoglobus vestalii TaxID=193384 RepID=A0A8H2PWX0_9MICO|nr:hypothetical protein FB472_1183 [Rhodoglobus vestalii]
MGAAALAQLPLDRTGTFARSTLSPQVMSRGTSLLMTLMSAAAPLLGQDESIQRTQLDVKAERKVSLDEPPIHEVTGSSDRM